MSLRILVAGLVSLAQACAVAPRWKSPLGTGHPLTGRIWDVDAAGFIEPETLFNRLVLPPFVLLGEKHDNPDHHALQARVLRAMIQRGRRPAVAFEMFNVDDAFTIARHLAASPKDAAGLGPAVGWNQRGWPDWSLYQPIAEVALESDLPIVAADLSPGTLEQLRRDGASALDDAAARRLGLQRPFPKDALEKMKEDLQRTHCGFAPEDRLDTMADIQRARDASLAGRIIGAGQRDGTVLVAGTGHTRKDYGVPVHLALLAPGKAVISVAYVEVAEGSTEPSLYVDRSTLTTPPFDYIWFTPRLDDRDPCKGFHKELERLKNRS